MPRPQITLRAMLLAMFVVGALLGGIAVVWNKVQPPAAPIAR
ncbi:MAG TPA: hypothetical protein VHC22_07015 [Pirellulales bacterium]|nr:hypothetical protein [Pirellulales bacterium]